MAFKFIGISGVARVGKDTLFKVLRDYFAFLHDVELERFAFADKLKEEIDSILIEKYGVSAFTQDDEEKAFIRPELVAHGKARREETQGQHWSSLIEKDVFASISSGKVPVITDVRYCVYPNDEGFWVKRNGGLLVHLSRILEDGNLCPPANDEEEKNDPIVKQNADLCLSVRTVRDPAFDLNYDAALVFDKFYE